ncbi:MAG: GDP-mannose 4,6-dehydratase [Ignavibacteria bacterium]|nr:GDP-mannose 4,6-dehydratase [Ignavibacteria bacterium]
MRYLITGGCGFVGSNLAAEVLKRNEELFVFDNLYRVGSEKNLLWLKGKGEFKFYHRDIRNYNDVENVIKEVKPDVIFHLAGQVAMTTSINDPRMDFEVNVLGTHNLLESVRKYSHGTAILYSSTNKVYGDLEYLTYEEMDTRFICEEYPDGFDEKIQLDFHSPYGCSKGAADQYLLDYYRMFGIKTVVFRHSSMYGGNQHPTYDQGWIGWFVQKAQEIKKGILDSPITISGNGKQVRDVLHSDDVVRLYFKAFEHIEKTMGQAFNIGGGIDNSLSLIELFTFLEHELNITIAYNKLPARVSDQKVFVADNKKIISFVEWCPRVNKNLGIGNLL